MSKHHHQSKEEQIFSKSHGAVPFHDEKNPYQVSGAMKSEDSPTRLRAYQIHLEKGGSDLDNWFEAEQFLRNSEQAPNSVSTDNRRGSGGGG